MALLSIPLLLSIGFSLGERPTYSCDSEIDLREPGKSFHSMPFLDQGDTNLCAPFTAAEMIDSWRSAKLKRTLSARERTSPMALGVEFAAKNDFPYSFPIQNSTDPLSRVPGRWGGIVCTYIRSAREIGACSDQVLKETQGKGPEAIAKTEALFQALKDYLALDSKGQENRRVRVAERIHTILSSLPPALDPAFIPSIEKISEELTFFTGDDPYVPLSRLLFASCRKHRTSLSDLPDCRSKIDSGLDGFGWKLKSVPFRGEEIFQTLKELLARKDPTPIAVTYCHRVVHAGHDYRSTSILSGDCAQHWSLVIGSRNNSGRCQFLLRDTDGGRPDRVSPDWEVDRGDVWIDAETLMRSTYMLQWLD